MLKGVGASQGYGIGKAVIIKDCSLDYKTVKYTTAEEEKSRLHSAVERYCEETKRLAEGIRQNAGEKEAEILEGHLMMLGDPFMLSQMEDNIDAGSVAEAGVDNVCNMFIDMFSGVDDELTRQRASDVKDIRDSLLSILLGVESVDIGAVPPDTVLIAKDFTPSMTSQIKRENVSAIITEVGGVTSHSAILARAMGIPAVLSVADVTKLVSASQILIADGFKGKVITDPTDEQLALYKQKQNEYLKEKESLNEYFNKPTVTKSGAVKRVYGNIGRAEDAQIVVQNGGEGIGLFRTEFLFMDREHEPDEQEQFEAYSTVAKALDGKEVIIRTLDIGGDKAVDYLNIEKEDNPFLGYRAVRYCLGNRKLYKTQIRAILRAAQYGNIKMMIPLVTTVEEVREVKKIINECCTELESEGQKYAKVPVGIMVETPSAAVISDLLAKEVDFFSIGTNDLTGYTMAVDRGNSKVSALYDTNQTAILRLIEMTIKNARNAGIEVGMCGEAAADEMLIPKLIEWGLDEFSVTPSSILQTRKYICNND